jgi:hypothetical protein
MEAREWIRVRRVWASGRRRMRDKKGDTVGTFGEKRYILEFRLHVP